ncbi:MAG TPA: aldehyde dehydrogenase [Streptosporangiaceae bacterium]|jgi:acyl-CoA reductase-like NAD-dependent aldehyde dehydrogenase
MDVVSGNRAPLRAVDRFFIGGAWVRPSSEATIEVIEPATEELFFRVAEAREADVERAVTAARTAFDTGEWPRLTHAARAEYLRAIAAGLAERAEDAAQIWPRESGVLHAIARAGMAGIPGVYAYYAGLAGDFPFEERAEPTGGGAFGLIVREPVGVVGAIIPWNAPMSLIAYKIAPALLAGCTVVLKASPEAPGAAYLMAEIAESVGLPPGVLNVLTADREVSELLVRDPRVDKIAFTGSTAAGRRIASLCGERIARYTLELGGKSAAVILDDMDLGEAAMSLAGAECFLSGQVCSSLTRIVVSRRRHDALVEALAGTFSQVRVGDPFDASTQMGPLAMARQRDRVEGYIAKGVAEGAVLATGGGRPAGLDRGYFIEPTVFGNVDNSATIAREEIFGPVLSVIAADDEADAVRVANDTPYGLNASVFTPDPDRARAVAGRLRSGTVGHNAFRTDFGIAFGGFKQSGIGREGGREGLLPYLETKTVILNETPAAYR